MEIYKITNTLNGKIYIGKDTTSDPKYYGSGLLIRRSINKYGIDNFTKEIIDITEDYDELSDKEKETYAAQLGDILGFFRKLDSVDITGIEPMAHAFPVSNVWDDDEVREPFTPERALMNAPAVRDNQIVVPKVVE